MIKVMIVDDEPLMRRGLISLVNWESMGCEVTSVCENGQQAIDIYNLTPPDIIVSDIKMPLVDGIALAQYIFEHERKAKIILLTAFADFSYAQKAITFGVSEYVTKTGYMDELSQAVLKCIAQLKTDNKGLKPYDNATALLCKIATGVLFSREEIENQAEDNNIKLSDYRLCLCDITQPEELHDEQFIELRKHATRLLEQTFVTKGGYILPLLKTMLGIVIPKIDETDVLAECKDITSIFATITKKLIFIGISDLNNGAHTLNKAYIEANKALSLSFFDRLAVHNFNQVSAPSKQNISILTDEISDALRRADNDACVSVLERFFVAQRQVCTDTEEVREQALLILNACCSALTKVGSDADDLSYNKNEWRVFIANAKSFEKICSILKELAADTCRTVVWFKSITGDIASIANEYIENNYCKNITLRDIAAIVNVHPSYLSRLFKQKTGMSVTDTITQLRINKAKMLLEDTSLLVSEIGQAVGIDDVTYFSYVFRKNTGVAPSKWLSIKQRLKKN